MGPLTTLVPQRERPTVQARAARLFELASRAGDGTPMCRRACFVVAACAPAGPVADLSTLVRYVLWSVVLDDRLDARGPDPVALASLRQTTAAVVGAGRAVGAAVTEPFWRELGEVVEGLAACDREGTHVTRFGEVLCDAIDAAITHTLLGHAVAAGEAVPPDAEQYLAVGTRTINYHSFGYGLLAVTAARLSPAAQDGVARALTHGAAAVRLANDLRSVERDRAEATLNILSLQTAAGKPVTVRYVQDEIRHRVRAHHAVLAPFGAPVAMLIRSLRLSVGLYHRSDLR